MKLDILAFGAHPDYIELSCAGTLIYERMKGKKVGIVDLTQGEIGTRGDVDTRRQEAQNAAAIMKIDIRDNLSMADGFFKNDKEHQLKIITALRKYQPEIVLCNAPEDRHPDHGRSADLVTEGAFLSGLQKIITYSNEGDKNESILQKEWRPKYVFNYIQDRYLQPDFVIDITEGFEKKIEAIKAFKSQFYNPESDEKTQTYLSSPEFLDSIIYRAKMFGKMIGVKYAEGYISKKMIGLKSFDFLIKENT